MSLVSEQIFYHISFLGAGILGFFFNKMVQRQVLESVMCSCAYLQANYK